MTADTSSPTVVLADDHPPTRHGVRLTLEGSGFRVCEEVGNGDAAVHAVARHAPDLALLDVDMPGGGGIAAASRIRETAPGTAVVMLTVARDDEHLFAAIEAGAVGYLLKDTNPDRLPLALRGVLAGEAAMPRELVARVIGAFEGRRQRRRGPLRGGRGASLTDREWEVLEALASGSTTKEIAERLAVSPVTVRRHVSAVLQKLDVGTRGEAVRLLDVG